MVSQERVLTVHIHVQWDHFIKIHQSFGKEGMSVPYNEAGGFMDSTLGKITRLHNGVQIPTIGYRVDKDDPAKVYRRVMNALAAGIRHLDLPADPDSEKAVGKALAETDIPRWELFITVKLGNADHTRDEARRSLDHSLKRIGTDSADLYLIEWPNPVKFRDTYEESFLDTWKGLEDTYKEGKAKAIGVANCLPHHLETLMANAEISPFVNQARMYPGFPFKENLQCAKRHSVLTEGFLPADHDAILNSRELAIFSEKYKASPRSICVRYLLEKECAALCQGETKEELEECFHAFDFDIPDDDLKFLDAMKNYGPELTDPDKVNF
jgi:diketogulonate reductase-like aldo/keto reductase